MAAAFASHFLRYSPEYDRLTNSSPGYDSETIDQFFEQGYQDTGKSEINRQLRLEVMKRFQIIGKPELNRLLKLEETNQQLCGNNVSKLVWLSQKEISETFQSYIQELEQPECYQALKGIFDLDHKTNITQCLCLGLGPFAIGVENVKSGHRDEYKNTSLHQLAVLTVILKVLGEQHNIKPVYFQDPVFTRDEREFLRSLGYKTMEDPDANRHMSTSTFVFAPFLGWNVFAEALKKAFPALYIGADPATYLDVLESQIQCVPDHNTMYLEAVSILRRFKDATTVGKALPKSDKERWTERTTVHWRSPAYEKVPQSTESDMRNARKLNGRRQRALQKGKK